MENEINHVNSLKIILHDIKSDNILKTMFI